MTPPCASAVLVALLMQVSQASAFVLQGATSFVPRALSTASAWVEFRCTSRTMSKMTRNLPISTCCRTDLKLSATPSGNRPNTKSFLDREGVVATRGSFFTSVVTVALAGSTAVAVLASAPGGASANGMLEFPPARLNNRYFLMRAGQGGADKEGVIQSHPIDKLHMDNRLTEQGVAEAQRAAGVLRAVGVGDPFIWADISSRAQDTARILAEELNIRQERVVPEYAFLEPRGMGIYDGKEAASILPEVYKEDATDLTWRPPPNTDGTPNESVDDVFVRVRQLLSKLETQYQGEDVVIVGADSDCLSVLQSFVLGEELGKHSKYYLRPGEGRQLSVSADTEYAYRERRESKSGV